MKKRVTFIVLLAITTPLWAQFDYGFEFSKAGTAGLQFLKIGTGGRHVAMGETATGFADDAEAVFWNVAGLALVESKEIAFNYNNWLVNSRHTAGVAAFPIKSYVVAFSVFSLAIDDFEETTVLQPDGTGRMVSARDILFGLSVAKRFTNKLSIGVQAKYVQEKLDDYSVDNILFDVGTLYDTGFRNLRLGFSLQHYGADMKIAKQSFRTPLIFRVGVADQVLSLEKVQWTAAVDLVHPTDNEEWLHFGTELLLLDQIAFRSGYRLNQDEGNLTMGLGLRWVSSSLGALRLDYAYSSFGDILGDVHRFSVGFELNQ